MGVDSNLLYISCDLVYARLSGIIIEADNLIITQVFNYRIMKKLQAPFLLCFSINLFYICLIHAIPKVNMKLKPQIAQ